MIDGICRANNKHPSEDEKNRVYFSPDEKISGYNGDLCARLKAGFLKLDIDDFDHRTGELDEPIKGNPRSEAVLAWLNSKGIRYNLMITEHGKHFYFRVPQNYPHETNKINWYSALGIKVEVKLGGGQSKEHIPFKVGGVLRKWAAGDMLNEAIDELPVELWPLQKSKNRPFDFTTLSDARNNGFSEYAFALAWKGYTIEQIQSTIQAINDFVLETGLRCSEIDTILREETLEKLRNIINQKEEKNLSPVAVANELLEQHHLIYLNGNLYAYQNGVYKPFGKDQINAYISKHYPFAKIRFRQEVAEQIKGAAYIDQAEESPMINVRNGMLEIADDGTITLHPHNPDIISFRQFHADYDPSAVCPVLDKALENAFSKSSEQIELFDQIMGYLMMNHTRYQKCFFWVGLPSSAKSTLSTMVRRFCGEENVSSVELEDLGNRFGLAGLVNKTLNIVPDIKKTKLFASGLFKALVGGDAVHVEQKYRESFDYVFTGKMIFGMNLFPDFSADFEGIERRLVILKFERVYKRTDPDYNPAIDDDLSTDEAMSALLNRAISGYKSLTQNKGFIETRKSKQQMAAFVSENDSVVAWVESLDDVGILEREPISGPEGLYKAYEIYCNASGERAKDQKDFTRIIKTRYGYESYIKRIEGKRMPMFRKKITVCLSF
ncbi:DNA primase family protein [Intestinimonas massiliensis (ex Afouda et al. 2020)]|uniref:DNA primase family protein n=1 Tax=Intestinimonas massiliensis (ex Afouda et al. 2020) TaxID=1673721 RepID=UPI000B9AC4F2|nr:phage/plasmid primase, P4 family [Intestinimonas massiliensis (ex Afouda et al. 2020)]